MNDTITRIIGKVKDSFSSQGAPEFVSSLAEDYTKRLMENHYDRLAQTTLFRRVKNLAEQDRLLLEFIFYSLNAYVKNSLPENTPIRAYIKGVVSDVFPEMGKRIINGQTPEGREVIDLMPPEAARETAPRLPAESWKNWMNPFRKRCITFLEKTQQEK